MTLQTSRRRTSTPVRSGQPRSRSNLQHPRAHARTPRQLCISTKRRSRTLPCFRTPLHPRRCASRPRSSGRSAGFIVPQPKCHSPWSAGPRPVRDFSTPPWYRRFPRRPRCRCCTRRA
jgi:hypothetical protein